MAFISTIVFLLCLVLVPVGPSSLAALAIGAQPSESTTSFDWARPTLNQSDVDESGRSEIRPSATSGFDSRFVEIPQLNVLAADRIFIENEVLPIGLLYRSYIAAPHEPRLGTVLHYDLSDSGWHWDSTLGGRVGLFRRGQPEYLNLDAWQIDLEGAAMPRLDVQRNMDMESADYRFGLLWTGKRDNLAFKFGYFHMSSHVGDEFMIANPTFERINYVRESLILGTSLQASPELRLYSEVAWAMAFSGGAEPWQFQTGAEYAAIADRPERGAPFSAINVQLREETNYAAGVTAMTGWQWTGPQSGRAIRIGLQYFNGPTNQYEFPGRCDNQLGAGIWFDY